MKKLFNIIEQSNQVIFDKQDVVLKLMTAMLCGGHVLLEDIPGVGKTTLVKWLSKAMGLSLGRIQFTNDLLPADIVGFNVYKQQDGTFTFKQGPLFSQLVLADELNRASPKTQSALLEAMEEGFVTVDRETYKLPHPFFVLATQNPRQHIGTHPLPESQLDRFMMKLEMGLPSRESEKKLLLDFDRDEILRKQSALMTLEEWGVHADQVKKQKVSSNLAEYVLNLLEVSRFDKSFRALGPRVGQDLLQGARAWSYLHGRDYVLPDDVKALVPSILGHRLVLDEWATRAQELDAAKRLIELTKLP